MIPITIEHQLPFIAVTIRANEKKLFLPKVLIDTGSAATVFRTEDMATLDIVLEPQDTLKQMFGVGGTGEYVIEKQVASLTIAEITLSPFSIQMGALRYGLSMDGILGTDFFLAARLILDFEQLILRQS